MRIGVPKEIKVLENRVGLTPASVREAVHHGHEVVVEHNAGQGIGMDDEAYRRAGAVVVDTAGEVFAARRADRQGQGAAGQRAPHAARRPGAVHLPALGTRPGPSEGSARKRRGVHRLRNGDFGLGRLAAARTRCPKSPDAWRSRPAPITWKNRTVVWACCSAACRAWIRPKSSYSAVASSARTPATSPWAWAPTYGFSTAASTCLRALWRQFGRPLNTVYSTHDAVEQHVMSADLVIGGVLIPGASAPKLVSRAVDRGA